MTLTAILPLSGFSVVAAPSPAGRVSAELVDRAVARATLACRVEAERLAGSTPASDLACRVLRTDLVLPVGLLVGRFQNRIAN